MRTDKEREGERAQLHARNSKFGNFILARRECLCVCVCTACVCVRGHKQQLGKNNLNILAKFHILSTFHWHYPTEIASKNRSEPNRIKARKRRWIEEQEGVDSQGRRDRFQTEFHKLIKSSRTVEALEI